MSVVHRQLDITLPGCIILNACPEQNLTKQIELNTMQRKDQVSKYIAAYMQEHHEAKHELGMKTWKDLSDS